MPFSLYKHPVYTRYRAPLWSCATLLSIVSLIAILVLPYFLAYASYGETDARCTLDERRLLTRPRPLPTRLTP